MTTETTTIAHDTDVSPEELRAARRAAYSRFSMEADARALQLVQDANQAQLRNFTDDLRVDHPTAQTFRFSTDDDGYLVVDFVRDADGNDLEDAKHDLDALLRGAEAEEMQALGHVTHDIDEMLAWEPAGGLAMDRTTPGTLTITTELTIKPGAGQTQEQAEATFLVLFREYLTQDDSAFLADYGPDAWGGYEGPTVTAVTVHGPGESSTTKPATRPAAKE